MTGSEVIDMKPCPSCAEQIQDEALVCYHCGRDVGPHERVSSVPFVRSRSRVVPMVIATVGAAIAAIAAFLPMVDAWDSGERLSMWNLMSTRDYESSGLSDITGVLVVVIPVVLTVALAGLMVLGSATAFRATSAAMAASSVMWLVWLTAWVSWWVDGWQADFNAVRWLLMLGPVLSLIAGVVGLVSVSRVQHVAPVPAPRVTPAPA